MPPPANPLKKWGTFSLSEVPPNAEIVRELRASEKKERRALCPGPGPEKAASTVDPWKPKHRGSSPGRGEAGLQPS